MLSENHPATKTAPEKVTRDNIPALITFNAHRCAYGGHHYMYLGRFKNDVERILSKREVRQVKKLLNKKSGIRTRPCECEIRAALY